MARSDHAAASYAAPPEPSAAYCGSPAKELKSDAPFEPLSKETRYFPRNRRHGMYGVVFSGVSLLTVFFNRGILASSSRTPPQFDISQKLSKRRAMANGNDDSKIQCDKEGEADCSRAHDQPQEKLHPQAAYKIKYGPPISAEEIEAIRGPRGPKFNVLVTGAAGFVGMHTCMSLKRDLNMTVVGYDNVNDYYDVGLKEARIRRLKQYKISMIRNDVCNATVLEETIVKHNITRIIHLAAQAGVRYSIEQPLAYTRNNIDCTIVLLETMVKLNMTQDALVYASSSSVYGNNARVPFKESDPVEDPASLYAVTKRSDELVMQAYLNLYGVPSIGLRFFTVYGPYGRPDMAPWIFTERIAKRKRIRMFNHGKSERDFTFIDDIVFGVVHSLFANVKKSAEIINLGNGRPIVLRDFVDTVQRLLNVSADIQSVPMQRGDVPVTFADISKARHMLGYSPKISIEQGMRKFVEWYRTYHNLTQATD